MRIMKYQQFNEAKLPDTHREKTISELPINSVVYVVPWMMKVDTDGECFLRDCSYDQKPGGTVILKVKKVANGVIAYINDIPKEDQSYYKDDFDKTGFIEVVGFDDSAINPIEDLNSQLQKAIDDEDYLKAAEIRKKMKKK